MTRDLTGIRYFELEAASKRAPIDGAFPCPCCNALAFGEAGGYEICDTCGWEDDPVQEAEPDARRGANGVSLIEARLHFHTIGYCSPDERRRRQKPRLP